jgi:hypothetical protein
MAQKHQNPAYLAGFWWEFIPPRGVQNTKNSDIQRLMAYTNVQKLGTKRPMSKKKVRHRHWLDRAEPVYWEPRSCWRVRVMRDGRQNQWTLKAGKGDSGPTGRAMAQYETEVRAERVRAGQDAAKKRGVTWGGSAKGWRWRVTDDQVSAINEMKAAGKKVTQIARVTGLSRPTTIYRVLGEPAGA